jgi:hypothetical protein
MARLCEGGRGRKYRLTCFAARPSPSGVVAHGWLKHRNQRRRPANWAESQEWGVGRTLSWSLLKWSSNENERVAVFSSTSTIDRGGENNERRPKLTPSMFRRVVPQWNICL